MIPGDAQTTETEAAPDFAYRSSMDAIARGTEDGLKLWLGIVAMLIVIVALVALADIILAHLPALAGAPITVERVFGWLFAPVVWLFGVPWDKAATAGSLMGEKTVLNEFVAYLKLAALPQGRARSPLAPHYALRHVRLRQSRFGRYYDRGRGRPRFQNGGTRSCRSPCARFCRARWRAV